MVIIQESIEVLRIACEKQFVCSGENIKKYITFTVPIEKAVTRIEKKMEKKL